MTEQNAVWAIGLMSGTSLDGVDVALLRTDGREIFARGDWLTIPYDADFQHSIRMLMHQSGDVPKVANKLTELHAVAVNTLLDKSGMHPKDIAVIGFHGQTIDHRPDEGISWQIGNPALLASMTGIDVVFDFRAKDLAEGGQGAPLVPLYHAALAKDLPKPLAIVNIGGIANVTWIDDDANNPWILAFDTGPGNALINDMVLRATGEAYDKDGQMALSGKVDERALQEYLYDTYFASPPPKSLDRADFGLEPVLHLAPQDALATLCEFTAQSIAKSADFLPNPPAMWLVCGGGRHNKAIMEALRRALPVVTAVEGFGFEGDALEAQAFAYLAVRHLHRLPISLPSLTGVRHPCTGGAFYPA